MATKKKTAVAATPTTTTTTTEKLSKAAILVKVDELIVEWNEAAGFGEFGNMNRIKEQLDALVEDYNKQTEDEVVTTVKANANPMAAAAIMLEYPALAVREGKDEFKNTVMARGFGNRIIDPLRVHRSTKDGIGADKRWPVLADEVGYAMTLSAANGMDAVNIKKEKISADMLVFDLAMSGAAQSEIQKSQPSPREIAEQAIKAMIGSEYVLSDQAFRFLQECHTKAGRNGMGVSASNSKTVRQRLLAVCHGILTGDPFMLVYKQAKHK